MEDRRSARFGTVSGLALLAGGTAVAAVAGGTHSIFATVLLGLLALVMGHALLVEIRRQARRRAPRWARQDTINAVLLGCWSEAAMITTILEPGPSSVRAVGLALTIAYAGSCGYFVTERRRAVAATQPTPTTVRAQPSPTPAAADEAAPSAVDQPELTPCAADQPAPTPTAVTATLAAPAPTAITAQPAPAAHPAAPPTATTARPDAPAADPTVAPTATARVPADGVIVLPGARN